jgi:IS605 OrfB family transposase
LFGLMEHFKAHTIIIEDLESLKPKDNGSKKANRKINNLWNRTFIKEIIERKCSQTGTILIYINPAYSSFIGNVNHNEYDPIAASIEIARRGINKYSKGGFYPEIDLTVFANDKMYDEIKECESWKDIFHLFVTSKKSYRRKLKNFSFVGYNIGSIKSKSKWMLF